MISSYLAFPRNTYEAYLNSVNERLVKVEERFRSLHPGFRPAHPCTKERIEVRSFTSQDVLQLITDVQKLEHLLPRAYEITSKNPRCS